MKPLAALVLALVWAALGATAFAQTQPAPAPTNNPLSYDDPGMHFAPPAGWERIALAPPDPSANGEAPVALYVKNRGRSDQQLITVEIKPFDGSLEGLESSHESDLRSAVDSTFIDKRQRTTLQNGMPAYFLKVSQGTEAGHIARRFDYVVFDTQRGIVVSYAGRAGDFDEKDALNALSSLYVVVYPGRRP